MVGSSVARTFENMASAFHVNIMSRPIYLVVTPFFPSPETWRGAYCYDFVRALMRTGRYDVRVFVPGGGPDYDYQGVHVYRFPMRMLPSAVLPFLFTWWNCRSFLRKVETVGLSCADIAVCHGHTAFFGIYPLALKRKNPACLALLHHHDPASFGLNLGRLRHVWLHKVINFFLLRRMHERIDLHVFISRLVERSFRAVPDASWSIYEDYRRQMRGLSWFRGVRVKAGTVLHNGVEPRVFHPGTSRPRGFVVGCVANFNEGKAQLDLLRAVVRLRRDFPDVEVRFIGTGEGREACRVFAREHGIHAVFLEEVDHTKLPDFYRSLDLFVLPSWWDGFGCVFTEAWASGVPFIASEAIGVAELIPDDERALWLFPPQNVDVLAERMAYYFRHRPKQHLLQPIDYDGLLPCFIDKVGGGQDLLLGVSQTSSTGKIN